MKIDLIIDVDIMSSSIETQFENILYFVDNNQDLIYTIFD